MPEPEKNHPQAAEREQPATLQPEPPRPAVPVSSSVFAAPLLDSQPDEEEEEAEEDDDSDAPPAQPAARAARRKSSETVLSCPRCTSTDIRKSTRHGKLDSLLRLIAFQAYRCRVCRHKFYR